MSPQWVFCARCHMAIVWAGGKWMRKAAVADRAACGSGGHEPAPPGQ